MKINSRSKEVTMSQQPQNEYDNIQKKADLQNILESCNTASNAAYMQSANPDLVNQMLTSIDPKQAASPLAQIYLKNFMERYSELKARDFAYNQTFAPVNNQLPLSYSQTQQTHLPPQASIPQQRLRPVSPRLNLPYDDLPESDGARVRTTKKHNSQLDERLPEEDDDFNDQLNKNNNNNNYEDYSFFQKSRKPPSSYNEHNGSNIYGGTSRHGDAYDAKENRFDQKQRGQMRTKHKKPT